MMVPGVCNFDPETVVLAHSNALADGKGKGYKTHDHLGAFACYACHSWLDQGGSAPKGEKDARFLAGQLRTRLRLIDIADSQTVRPAKKAAAQWGLDRLVEDGLL